MAYVTIKRRPPLSRPRADMDDWEPVVMCRDVIVADDDPAPTGLLDQHGTPIYRVADRIKMGFV